MGTIGFIGSGNMAEAIIKGILAGRAAESGDILISDVRPERLAELSARYDVGIAYDNLDLVTRSSVVFLAVKPQTITEVLEQARSAFSHDKLVISIAAGIRTAKITTIIGQIPVIRVMPNTPVLVGEGVSVIYATAQAHGHLSTAVRLFSAVGFVTSVEDESLMDAVTAVSGSGPAYFFMLMEEMIKASVAVGLPPQMAHDLVLHTARGAAILACEADKSGESAAELRKKVTSPRGTTEAAMNIMINEGCGQIIIRAIKAARDRSIELSA
ncbi:MAG TPA: pyrroline-5-carboxylate reductase [Sedimentisphaerales bacterium]|nr:pyrroline-5-carboxylate reductase [Sedimentisphaerales bacterium]